MGRGVRRVHALAQEKVSNRMHTEYHKWFSPNLNRDMELKVYGHAGFPMLVFPTSMGRFYQYADQGMIAARQGKYENGELQAFCVDSVDEESWYNKHIPPHDRILRHIQYEQYLLQEVVPFIQGKNAARQFATTGCSFGGYHSAAFGLKHPDLVSHIISFGGAFDIKQFLGGYYDDNAYYNNPIDFVAGSNDDAQLERFRHQKIVMATGETDICLDQNLRFAEVLSRKSVPFWLDVWGDGTGHDWHWWQAMAVKFL